MKISYPERRHASFRGTIGIAREDITPPVGIYARNWGQAKQDVAEGIHQSLLITCITFQSGTDGKPLVLIGADLGWWKNSVDEGLFRSRLLSALELEPPQLMFCLSHTHAGPSTSRDDRLQPGGNLIEGYLDLVLERSIAVVQRALSSAIPATLAWHYGKCALAANRDLASPDKDRYVVGFNPGQVADDTLLLGRITDEQGRVTGTIVNYACHPTTLAWENRLISPDYVGAMRALVERETGALCLFLQGASGDLAPVEQYSGNTKLAESHGRQLGFAALATLEDMLPPGDRLVFVRTIPSGAPLGIWERSADAVSCLLSGKMISVDLPLKPLPTLQEIEEQWKQSGDRVLKERLWRRYQVRKSVGDGTIARISVWVWRLGDSFLVGHPNEAYSGFQLALRGLLSGQAVAIMNVVNGSIGYLPPEELYDGRQLYSVQQTPFGAGSLEILTKMVSDTIKEMHAEE